MTLRQYHDAYRTALEEYRATEPELGVPHTREQEAAGERLATASHDYLGAQMRCFLDYLPECNKLIRHLEQVGREVTPVTAWELAQRH